MATDSRLTLTFPDTNFSDPNNPNAMHFISVPQSDSTRKLFLAQGRIGISTCGNATIGNVPISGFIESFIRTLPEGISVEDTTERLLQHFVKIDTTLATFFHVAGYSDSGTEKLTETWFVSISTKQRNMAIGRGQQDARWNGVLDILQRLFLQVYLKDPNGNYQAVLAPGIALNHLALQDAVDLAVFGMRTTIDLMNFQSRLRTVGGPIDVLVIKSESSQWLGQKQLHVAGSSSAPGPIQFQPTPTPPTPSKSSAESTKNRTGINRASRRTFMRLRPANREPDTMTFPEGQSPCERAIRPGNLGFSQSARTELGRSAFKCGDGTGIIPKRLSMLRKLEKGNVTEATAAHIHGTVYRLAPAL